MAIGADSLVEFFGTQDDITNASNGTIAADVYSVAGDIDTWTNDDDAPEASVMLHWTGTSPAAGGSVLLYATLLDIDSTNDEAVPTASDESAHLLGRFKVPVSASSYIAERVQLPNSYTSQQYQFFLLNKTNQTMSNTWTLKITPITQGPHA